MSAGVKVQTRSSCSTCDEMQREYTQAMTEYLKIQLELYMATAGRNRDEEALLRERGIAAEARCESLKLALRRHEDSKHNEP